jgi:hypothetical protein
MRFTPTRTGMAARGGTPAPHAFSNTVHHSPGIVRATSH